MTNLDALAEMDYPGQAIILGKTKGDYYYAAYVLTSRHFQERKLVEIKTKRRITIQVAATSDRLKEEDKMQLHLYNAMGFLGGNIAVSNGIQTDAIWNEWMLVDSIESIVTALRKGWGYEPDAPHYTPRIGGFINSGITEGCSAALAIIKNEHDEPTRNYFQVPMIPRFGKMIATYNGPNIRMGEQLPYFTGEPRELSIESDNAEEIANLVYSALDPKERVPDFRVGVAVIVFKGQEIKEDLLSEERRDFDVCSYVINRAG
jgi:IMP cyclohydrolase